MKTAVLALVAIPAFGLSSDPPAPPGRTFALDTLAGLKAVNVKASVATLRGRKAVRLLHDAQVPAENRVPGADPMAVLTGTDFEDGTIEVDVAGSPRAGAAEGARGFIGIAFRVQGDGAKFEYVYLRPTNGRSEDQLRRNHSTQYASHPDFPWERLRKENPGVYESYVDLEPGVWTRMKIVVSGVEAKLFVHGASQPALVVHDLKLGRARGPIALWVGLDTDSYFSNLTVR